MTTGLSYNGTVSGTTSYITQISTLAVVEATNSAFLAILPQMLTYAENRIYRDIDFLSTQVVRTYTLSSGTNVLTIPASDFITVQTLNINYASNAYRPLIPTTKEFIRNVYGDPAAAGVPMYFAMYGGDLATYGTTSDNILVGPTPNASFTMQVSGTVRPPSLGDGTNGTVTSTFVSLYLPDLLIMASMIYISAYQRNFGRANDDPQMAVTYESQYNALLKGAVVEEARKKFQAAGWTAYSPSQVATPTRG